MHASSGVSSCEIRKRSVSHRHAPRLLMCLPLAPTRAPSPPKARRCWLELAGVIPFGVRGTWESSTCVETTCLAMGKSNIVPAPGLEPGRPSFKGWWAANYPTPERGTLLWNAVSVASDAHDTGRPAVAVSAGDRAIGESPGGPGGASVIVCLQVPEIRK